MKYACPKCKSRELEVVVEVWATLIQTDDGFETDTTTPDNGDHEWGENSVMRCTACDTHGIADEFTVREGEEVRT